MSLLGPVGPEVSCEECFERLDEYVERPAATCPAWRRTSRAARPVARITRACSRWSARTARATRGKNRRGRLGRHRPNSTSDCFPARSRCPVWRVHRDERSTSDPLEPDGRTGTLEQRWPTATVTRPCRIDPSVTRRSHSHASGQARARRDVRRGPDQPGSLPAAPQRARLGLPGLAPGHDRRRRTSAAWSTSSPTASSRRPALRRREGAPGGGRRLAPPPVVLAQELAASCGWLASAGRSCSASSLIMTVHGHSSSAARIGAIGDSSCLRARCSSAPADPLHCCSSSTS